MNKLPIAIIGAGPIGLAAACRLLERGETPIVFEAAGTSAAATRPSTCCWTWSTSAATGMPC